MLLIQDLHPCHRGVWTPDAGGLSLASPEAKGTELRRYRQPHNDFWQSCAWYIYTDKISSLVNASILLVNTGASMSIRAHQQTNAVQKNKIRAHQQTNTVFAGCNCWLFTRICWLYARICWLYARIWSLIRAYWSLTGVFADYPLVFADCPLVFADCMPVFDHLLLFMAFWFPGPRLLVDSPVCDQTPRCVLVALIWVARCRVLWLVFSFHGPRLFVD